MSTILLIESDRASRSLAAWVLQQAGCHVVQGSRPREAWALAHRHAPALALMGVPSEDDEALRAARRLRGDPALAGLRLHALVARAAASRRPLLLAAGFDGLLAKPLDPRSLLRLLHAELRRSR